MGGPITGDCSREMNERYKIGEAKYFLARMEKSGLDPVAFQYNYSAFLSAARSVTQYAREESSSKGREQWYDETVPGNDDASSQGGQTTFRRRFADRAGSEDLVSSAHRYIEELEKFVQRGVDEGILSG